MLSGIQGLARREGLTPTTSQAEHVRPQNAMRISAQVAMPNSTRIASSIIESGLVRVAQDAYGREFVIRDRANRRPCVARQTLALML